MELGRAVSIARQSWAPSLEHLKETVARRGDLLIVLKEGDSPRTDTVAEAKVIGGARRTLSGSALPPLRIWGYDPSVAAINVSSSSLQLTGKGGELGLS